MRPLPQVQCRLGAPGMLRRAVNAVFGVMGRGRSGTVVEEVRRFDSAFDEVTGRHTAWGGFWCPLDSEFLNWRHLDRPGVRLRRPVIGRLHHVVQSLQTGGTDPRALAVSSGRQRCTLSACLRYRNEASRGNANLRTHEAEGSRAETAHCRDEGGASGNLGGRASNARRLEVLGQDPGRRTLRPSVSAEHPAVEAEWVA
jgi:hypothetical protein